jgi:hypothetical protein
VDAADVERVSREIHILKQINHPNVIKARALRDASQLIISRSTI